jgi:sulfate/thiosulfate transport system substrate-binding protein
VRSSPAPSRRRLRCVALVCLATLAAAAGCGGSGSSGDSGGASLSLVAYSTPREAYEEIVPAFQKTTAGNGVEIQQSYAASGEQSRAVESGLPADVVAFSLEPDVTRLVSAGLVSADWNAGPHHGMVTDSLVVFVVRKGNPKNITTWADLIRPGIEVVTPNPLTSGGAQWNVMAAYGAQRKLGRSDAQALDFLRSLFGHVVAQDKSARESLQTFLGGKGDVLLAYENEAIAAQQAGESLDYKIPDQTILIENPVAVVSTSGHLEEARAFVRFLYSPQAQRIFARHGYRPVVGAVLARFTFPAPPTLFTIGDVGGWTQVRERFFDPEKGAVSRILQGQAP